MSIVINVNDDVYRRIRQRHMNDDPYGPFKPQPQSEEEKQSAAKALSEAIDKAYDNSKETRDTEVLVHGHLADKVAPEGIKRPGIDYVDESVEEPTDEVDPIDDVVEDSYRAWSVENWKDHLEDIFSEAMNHPNSEDAILAMKNIVAEMEKRYHIDAGYVKESVPINRDMPEFGEEVERSAQEMPGDTDGSEVEDFEPDFSISTDTMDIQVRDKNVDKHEKVIGDGVAALWEEAGKHIGRAAFITLVTEYTPMDEVFTDGDFLEEGLDENAADINPIKAEPIAMINIQELHEEAEEQERAINGAVED